MFRLVKVSQELPADFEALRFSAKAEGYRFVERLYDEWITGENTFSKKYEALFIAYEEDIISGVGGITHDPKIPCALRFRRFYILPKFRKMGLAKQIVNQILEHVSKTDFMLTVNAGTEDALIFWESMGFNKSSLDGITHVLS